MGTEQKVWRRGGVVVTALDLHGHRAESVAALWRSGHGVGRATRKVAGWSLGRAAFR